MKSMRKTRLNAAVTAALVGVAGATDVATAQTVERTGTGQVLIFPYYTVNDSWVTTFNVTNTSTKTLAVKFRMREHKNTRDVLDFNIVMSPYDVWTAWVKQGDEGGTQLFTNDESCTSPTKDKVNGAAANPIAYSGSQADGGGEDLGRLQEGYVEMLVMGETDTITRPPPSFNPAQSPSLYVPWHAEHVDGVPRDCVLVDQAFLAQTMWDQQSDLATVGTEPGTGDPKARADFVQPAAGSNPLKGNISWLQLSTGAGAGSTALAVSDWAQGNLVTAQEFPWFLEPTFVTNTTPWTLNPAALTAFEQAIGVSTAFNEWATNPATGATTDWVITFPTKAYHVDKFNEQIQAAVSKYRNALNPVVNCTGGDALDERGTCTDLNLIPLEPFTNLFSVRTDGEQPLGDSPVLVTYTFFDREEAGVVTETGETEISPAPPPEIVEASLRFEANVVQFGDVSILDSGSAAIIGEDLRPEGAINGWGSVTFPTGGATGMPAVGFAVKARDQGEPSSAYGQAMDHGYSCPGGTCQ